MVKTTTGAKILLYHSISNQKDKDDYGLRVSVNNFREQLCYLSQEGYEVTFLSEITQKMKNNPKIAAITFDDGYSDNLKIAAPLLKKYKMPATLFVSTAYLKGEQPISNYWDKWDHLLPEHLKALVELGFEIGSHSHLHKKLNDFDDNELEHQLKKSRDILEKIVGTKVEFCSYPHGIFNDKIKAAVRKSGYQAACSSIMGVNNSNADLFELRRIEIDSTDSINEFKNKLDGDYNWLGYLQKRKFIKYA